ncbi:unnamed protein product [Mytilus edulis]|uniref:Metalloendopeptidase n=1 Tax=Mytilus edulis TaxID=6550 RepID=A0A8S3VKJ7_MYTED|nr:unnamed protein product [Mytilus edulis]
MHALSFHHEMQRYDNNLYLKISKSTGSAYRTTSDKPLTRFDPFSVMMYQENRQMTRKNDDPIWKLKTSKERCQELSELNKVALNIIFKPCYNETKHFQPKLSAHTEMLYCGRQVMSTHNQIGESTTDGNCGPSNWANCAACRVIKQIKHSETETSEIPTLKKCLENGKWQGLSGLFYCGKNIKIPISRQHVVQTMDYHAMTVEWSSIQVIQ